MTTLAWIAVVTASILISGGLCLFLGYRWGKKDAREQFEDHGFIED